MIRCSMAVLCAALAIVMFVLGPVRPAAAQDDARVMIIMDGSGSMWGKIGKQTKLAMARRAMRQLSVTLPDDVEIGLTAYGHRSEGDCGDIQVLLKPRTENGNRMARAVADMKFQGRTPLAAALREAAVALEYEDQPATVILITDGPDNCDADPCATAEELAADGLDFTAHVVGFGVTRAESRALSCIADRTGGQSFTARNARQLSRAVTQALGGGSGSAPGRGQVMADRENADADAADLQDDALALDDMAADDMGAEDMGADDMAADDMGAAGEESGQVAYFRGAPVMLNTAIAQVGSVGVAAQTPTAPDFPQDAEISDCQIVCEGDPLCAGWRYEPDSASDGGAQCIVFDYAAALDYTDQPADEGWASGMKVGAVQLVRPYVPAAEPQDVAEEPEAAAEPEAEAELAAEDAMTDAEVAEAAVADEAMADAAVADEPASAPDDPPAEMAFVAANDPLDTLMLPGVSAKTEAGYRCDGQDPCGVQDEATGLVFALPPGWASDLPVYSSTPEGTLSDIVVLTLFGPEAADGSLPTVLLNPGLWSDANGTCIGTGAGALCIWGEGDEVMRAAVEVIAPSLAAMQAEATTGDAAQADQTDTAGDAGNVPVDGTWQLQTGEVSAENCPAGFETALDGVVAGMSGPRDIAWGGAFDPARLGLDVALPGLSWQEIGDGAWTGETYLEPIPGQPPFLIGIATVDVALTNPDTVGGRLTLRAFASGTAVASLISKGLEACEVRAGLSLAGPGG